MEISRKTDYALRLLLALSSRPKDTISLREIAHKQDIPYSFARTIQYDLVQSGYIESFKGAHGGIRLSVDPKKITLLEIVESVQGSIEFTGCAHRNCDGSACERMGTCVYHPIWEASCLLISDFLSSVTLFDIINKTKAPHISQKFASEHSFDMMCDIAPSA